METLSNFISIHCLISFVIGAVLMLVSLAIAAMGKDYEPRNKVRFFVAKDNGVCGDDLRLWMGKPKWDNVIKRWMYYSMRTHCLCVKGGFKSYNLNPDDFADMKVGEIREVFINLED